MTGTLGMMVSSLLPITMVFITRTAWSSISLEAAPTRGEEKSASRNKSWALSGHWQRVVYLVGTYFCSKQLTRPDLARYYDNGDWT